MQTLIENVNIINPDDELKGGTEINESFRRSITNGLNCFAVYTVSVVLQEHISGSNCSIAALVVEWTGNLPVADKILLVKKEFSHIFFDGSIYTAFGTGRIEIIGIGFAQIVNSSENFFCIFLRLKIIAFFQIPNEIKIIFKVNLSQIDHLYSFADDSRVFRCQSLIQILTGIFDHFRSEEAFIYSF